MIRTGFFTAPVLLCNRTQAAKLLKLSWKEDHGVMARAVERGLVRRDREEAPVDLIHVDEKAFKRGHKYVTVVSEPRDGEPCVFASLRYYNR